MSVLLQRYGSEFCIDAVMCQISSGCFDDFFKQINAGKQFRLMHGGIQQQHAVIGTDIQHRILFFNPQKAAQQFTVTAEVVHIFRLFNFVGCAVKIVHQASSSTTLGLWSSNQNIAPLPFSDSTPYWA